MCGRKGLERISAKFLYVRDVLEAQKLCQGDINIYRDGELSPMLCENVWPCNFWK